MPVFCPIRPPAFGRPSNGGQGTILMMDFNVSTERFSLGEIFKQSLNKIMFFKIREAGSTESASLYSIILNGWFRLFLINNPAILDASIKD